MPQGAYPTACGSYYPADIEELKAYQGAAKDPAEYAHYFEKISRRFGGEA